MISRFGALPSAPLFLHCTAPLLLHSSARSTPASPPPPSFSTRPPASELRTPTHRQAHAQEHVRPFTPSLPGAHTHTYTVHMAKAAPVGCYLKKRKKKLKPYIRFHKSAHGNDYTTQIERYNVESWSDTLEHGFSELKLITNLRVHVNLCTQAHACTLTLGLCASIDNSSLCSCFVFLKRVGSVHWLCASPAPNLCLCAGLSRSCFLI